MFSTFRASTMVRYARRLGLFALFAVTRATADPVVPAMPPDSQAEAVAQVVMGILSYSRWPAAPDVVRLCVLGDTPYANVLLDGSTQLPGLAVRARRVAVNSPELSGACEAVYIGATRADERTWIFDRIAGRPVVNIIENDPECAVNSMFCLDIQAARVGFQVNLDSIARSGVRVHPSVLQLARRKPSP
jgi:hypothetical protein